MGILDSIVEWIATQIMNLLDLVTGSVLGALGCDMSTFLRYFPAAETLYEVFVAIAVGFILLNLVWQLFKNFGLGVGLSAEDPTKLAIKSILFIFSGTVCRSDHGARPGNRRHTIWLGCRYSTTSH